jgi:flagellar basal-body rod protein FlgC
MSNLLNSLVIASSGLDTQARRLNVVSQNIANVDTPGYRRKTSEFAGVVGRDDKLLGVKMVRIGLDDAPLKQIHDPSHPLAGPDGSYLGSNVNLLVEVADAREAQRSYEANLKSFENARQMSRALLELLRK